MTATSRLIVTIAPFVASYAICGVAEPCSATIEAVLMIEPPPSATRYGSWYFRHRNTPVWLIATTRCQSAELGLDRIAVAGQQDARVVEADVDPPEAGVDVRVEPLDRAQDR